MSCSRISLYLWTSNNQNSNQIKAITETDDVSNEINLIDYCTDLIIAWFQGVEHNTLIRLSI